MSGAERKRAWRLRNPEASATAERERAQARRNEVFGSYQEYECTLGRIRQRAFYSLAGAGAHKMTHEERVAAIDARGKLEWDAMNAKFGTNTPYPVASEHLEMTT